MIRIVEVLIERGRLSLDRPFTYFYDGQEELHVGMRVKVGFASSSCLAFIIKEPYEIDKTIEEGIYDRDPNVKDRANMIRKIPIRSMDKFLKTMYLLH